jgi:signal transduction histidine kinase
MLLTREQLQERLIALHQASLELVKDVSLEHLLERIAATAREQASAKYAALGVLDEEGQLKQFITAGMTPAETNLIDHPPLGLGLIGAMMRSAAPLRIPVIQDDPRSVGFPRFHPPMTSFLGVPIRAADRQLGQIYLADKTDASEFTADDEQVIQMLAAYAAAAIQNARIVEHMKERDLALTHRNVDLALLNGIATTLASSLELGEILNKTLAQVMNYMRAEAAEIFLLDADQKTLRMVLHRGQAAEAFWTRNVFRVGEGPIGRAALERVAVVEGEASSDLHFVRQAVIEAGFRKLVCVPLLAGEQLMGVMTLADHHAEPVEDRSLQLLVAVGTWAGLAIENARLHQDARRLAVLEERDRIGMDLHDGIIQSIYGVGLGLESARQDMEDRPPGVKDRVRASIDGLNQAIRDIRAYILDLRPRQLGDEGLVTGLRRLALEYRANTFSDVSLSATDADLKELPHSHALALFHICQEALANAAKHAKAVHATVSVWATSDRVLMEVRDDGRGFDLQKVEGSLGHGLVNMQTRARAVGGEVDITSSIGEGTAVLAWVPRGLT